MQDHPLSKIPYYIGGMQYEGNTLRMKQTRYTAIIGLYP
jgi:hypothetical protein